MRYLFIGAHADDIEIGCGGTLLKAYKKNQIFNYIATNSEYSDENGKLVRSKLEAKKEIKRCYLGKKIQNILGTSKVFDLNNNEKFRTELIRLKKKIKPAVVFLPWIHDPHPDHKNLAEAALTVFKDASNILMYRSNWYYSINNFNKNFYSDITTNYKYKIKMVLNFKSEVKRTKSIWIKKIENECVANGNMINKNYAEAFEIVKLSSGFRL
ncbi:PIG-L family deacetylase [Candidatus Pelagibacter bacterium]|nr:PIG-L family deacetylase [Candidatus Pelagibacter bacterium]MDA8836274.1 PIG-L family deacetylase [Candidatus Pelagibacter bacterium]